MSHPEPTRARHAEFCEIERWKRVRDARGRSGTHHVTFELELTDGRILRTRISHPPDRTGYGPSIWAHILRDHLDVTAEVFWACVLDKALPPRSSPLPDRESLPADLVHMLVHRVGLADAEVAVLTKAEAIARAQQFWTTGS
ncbi:cytotoxic translational repressor of toxin-antitoxin stability system [Nocardia lasii]|uniref:Cytotoxic translational repressor of toxin-antitoxin stability system n=1 Tax=Nocardia lasii TaxID=1616107 RepID=A0ABW1JJI0_9NOCA